MPQPTKIPRPFADSGDKNSIPDSTGNIGFASWQEGFPQITSEPFANGGVAPKRADFNGIFNALSLATVWQQQGGVYAYDNTTDYEVGNLAEDSGDIYQCMVANGPNSTIKSPSDQTVWSKVINVQDLNSILASYLTTANAASTYALKNDGQFNKMFFSQTSGSYTAPYTGIYRITLKGGGGGGGGLDSNVGALAGLGGGEGGTLIFYYTLTKSQSYTYTIGAGGAAGDTNQNGNSGGATTFNGIASASGGTGGAKAGNITKTSGGGGGVFTVPTGITALKIPGACGESCGGVSNATSFPVSYAPCGGGNGGANGVYGASFGGGGSGASNVSSSPPAAKAGADGYILIEYAG